MGQREGDCRDPVHTRSGIWAISRERFLLLVTIVFALQSLSLLWNGGHGHATDRDCHFHAPFPSFAPAPPPMPCRCHLVVLMWEAMSWEEHPEVPLGVLHVE